MHTNTHTHNEYVHQNERKHTMNQQSNTQGIQGNQANNIYKKTMREDIEEKTQNTRTNEEKGILINTRNRFT